ncbi:MAG: adenosine deaminase, partial [Chloroflexi bacterium]|nr:adenosine deaminase [Chloroflexota bacterium]
RWGTRLRLIPDIVRNQPAGRAAATLEWALAHRDAGVVAIGVAGVETAGDQVARGPLVDAAAAGLHRVAHAGEQDGPRRIWEALDDLGAERIGHGIRAVDDPALIERLARDRVPLELCPSSNVALGLSPSWADHPFDRLWRSGVRVSVNSDDPPLFGTTLGEEYLKLATTFAYGEAELVELARAALDHAFLEPADRVALGAEFERRLTASWAGVSPPSRES